MFHSRICSDTERIDRRVLFKGLGKQSKIDVLLDSHVIHFHATKSPKTAWKDSNRTKIKNTSTLDAIGSNKMTMKSLYGTKASDSIARDVMLGR